MTDNNDDNLSDRIREARERIERGEDPEVAFAGIPNWRKWWSDPGWIVVVGSGPTDEELREVQARIAAGEGETAVWAEIDARVELRERQRLGVDWPVRRDG